MMRIRFDHDVRVVKLGGSLLESNSVDRLPNWLAGQAPMHTVLIVGGGTRVEMVRRLQPFLGLSDREAHWLSVSVMDQNAIDVADRLACIGDAVQAFDKSLVSIVSVEELLLQDAEHENALPQDWSVTSDSIAARIAEWASAKELVLLKSMTPTATTVAELVHESVVDDAFAVTFRIGRLRIVNARKAGWPERWYPAL